MKTPTQRGPYGRWLQAARLERGLSTAEGARQALETAGVFIAKSTYAEYESGAKVPSRNHLPELERFFGPFHDPASGQHTPEAGSDLSALVAELRMQNALMATALGLLSQDVAMSPQARQAMDDFLEQAKARSTSQLPTLHPTG